MNVVIQSILIIGLSVLMYSILRSKEPTQDDAARNKTYMYVGAIVFVVSILLLSMTGSSTQLVHIQEVSSSKYKPPF